MLNGRAAALNHLVSGDDPLAKYAAASFKIPFLGDPSEIAPVLLRC